MEIKDVKKIIKDFIKSGGEMILFTGGEPTLRDDLAEIIAYSENFNNLKSISIITNGARLANKKYLLELIKADKNNIISFSVSLHSHRKDISEFITKSKGTFSKTIKGIENLINAFQRVSIYQVITAYNYKDILEFCYFLNKNYPQIKNIVFAYPFPYGKALINDDIYVPLDLLKPYFIKALKFLETNNYNVKIANCGQLPPCVLPGFEEKVLDSRFFNTENVLGTIGKKHFQPYEYNNEKWIKRLKAKSDQCQDCILNVVCQGLWKKYIDLFGFRGIQPVKEINFKNYMIVNSLKNYEDLKSITKSLIHHKLNFISITDIVNDQLDLLLDYIKQKNIYCIIKSGNKIIYPMIQMSRNNNLIK